MKSVHLRCVPAILLIALICASSLRSQESPYIVAYDHYLEEPGNLDIEYFSTFGTQRAGNDFHAFWMEFEYGVKAWWTTEVYIEGQTTFGESTLFVGDKGLFHTGGTAGSFEFLPKSRMAEFPAPEKTSRCRR